MKLIKDNYAQNSSTTVSASSSKANFPASNVKHEFRSKEWRSSGHFVVSASNKALTVDATPVDLVEGTYTATTLSAHIKAQLESVSAKTFSVSNSATTGLWTVSADATFSLSGALITQLGFDSLTGDDSYTGARICIHTEEWITFDFKTTEETDTVAMLWEAGNFRLSADATITIQANATNTFSSPAFSQVIAFDDRNEIAQLHLTSPESYRYWRIKIQDPENAHLYVSLGTVVIGKAESVLVWTSNGFSFNFRDNSNVQQTPFGQTYTDIFPKLKSLSLKFDAMTVQETTALIDVFNQVGGSQPVFISLDPNESVFTSGEFWIYGKLQPDLGLSHQVRDVLNSSITVYEIN